MATDELSKGMKRVQFTCKDCGKEVDREPHKMDVPGLTPSRCVQCTFGRMAKP